jgi:hypothetical protein
MKMQQDPNNYWEQLERLEKLIRASELKAGVIFSFHSLVLGLFFDRLDYLESVFNESPIFIGLITLWLLFVVISIFFSIRCFIPQIELKYDKNVFFFRDAALKFGTIEEYTSKLISVCSDENELYKQLSEQIHIESKIIDEKFKNVRKAIKFLAASFMIIILLLGLWLITL